MQRFAIKEDIAIKFAPMRRTVYAAHGRKMFDRATDGPLIRGYVKATGAGLAGPASGARFILHSEATAWLP
jgi:hypothetical protein